MKIFPRETGCAEILGAWHSAPGETGFGIIPARLSRITKFDCFAKMVCVRVYWVGDVYFFFAARSFLRDKKNLIGSSAP